MFSRKLAAGHKSTVCISEEGFVYTFGSNEFGQLGDETDIETRRAHAIPKRVKNFVDISNVASGSDYVVCVDRTGSVWSFGENENFCLGYETNAQYGSKPKKVENLPPILSVDCGMVHTICIAHDYIVWSFGDNEYGQLCLGNNQQVKTPQQTSLTNISAVACGGKYTILIKDNREVLGCGYNDMGQLGVSGTIHEEPILIPGLPSISQVTCGYFHTLFLSIGGGIYSTGHNAYGQLGIGNSENQFSVQKIPSMTDITLIGCGICHSMAASSDGSFWTFGYNAQGQLGLGHENNIFEPTLVSCIKDVSAISVGGHHTIVKCFDNSIYAMGYNGNGQIGKPLVDQNTISPLRWDSENENIIAVVPKLAKTKSARK